MPSLLSIQAAVALLGLPVAAAWPPSRGTILVVPVAAGAERGLAAGALDAGARLLERGPLPGSLVVQGERARLRAIPGALLLAAAPTACGDAQ